MRPHRVDRERSQETRRARNAVQALNFFMADAQAGIGPFLGVFLQARGWGVGPIGAVMTIGGIAGMIVTIPAGALVDATTRKRSYIIVSAIFTLLASALIWVSQSFWVIAGSQVATAIAGAAIGPGMAGLTLGIFRQAGFTRQNGRNQAFNHAGNVVGAALSGLLGWKFGFTAVFWLAAVFAIFAIISTLLIPKNAIDDRVARGFPTTRRATTSRRDSELFSSASRCSCSPPRLHCFTLGMGRCCRCMDWPSLPRTRVIPRHSSPRPSSLLKPSWSLPRCSRYVLPKGVGFGSSSSSRFSPCRSAGSSQHR
jgi:MFS family permease